jgi:hypothetical protein
VGFYPVAELCELDGIECRIAHRLHALVKCGDLVLHVVQPLEDFLLVEVRQSFMNTSNVLIEACNRAVGDRPAVPANNGFDVCNSRSELTHGTVKSAAVRAPIGGEDFFEQRAAFGKDLAALNFFNRTATRSALIENATAVKVQQERKLPAWADESGSFINGGQPGVLNSKLTDGNVVAAGRQRNCARVGDQAAYAGRSRPQCPDCGQ